VRVRSWRFLPSFFIHALRSAKQAAAEGSLSIKLSPDRHKTFWTSTSWTVEAAMKRFMTTGAHGRVMKKLLEWCDEAAVVRWIQDSPELPSWEEAHARLKREGRPSKVNHPSPAHTAFRSRRRSRRGAAIVASSERVSRPAKERMTRTAVVAIVVTGLSCTACAQHDPADNEPPAAATPLLAPPRAVPPLELALTAAEALAWPYHQELDSDLDGDAAMETVIISCDVTLDDTGRPLWEDGHGWALMVRDATDHTLVYSAFVPHGFVEAAVLAPVAQGTREILVQERTPDRLRSMAIGYTGPGQPPTAAAIAHYEIESWLPRSATLRP
jgi:hypothetical protein